MATAALYPATATFDADTRTARWRPLVQWLLAIPQLVVLNALSSLRGILELFGSVAVVFTGRVPRPLFDAITMTLRYEWRVLSYTVFFDDDYPVFEFMPAADDDGHQRHSTLTIAYPEQLNRWKPLYKWVLAVPHYVVCVALVVASVVTIVGSAIAVIVTGRYPEGARRFLIRSYRYGLRVQAYVGPLTDEYPPFSLAA
jgi:roadblock/LC7 domain-containing protein